VLLDVEVDERATVVFDENEDDERLPVSGTLVEGDVDVACRAKIGFAQRVLLPSLDVEDHERYELEELEPEDEVRCGGQGSSAGLPGMAGAVSAGLPCGTQDCRAGVTA
jgi:hypothetical protein